MYRKFLSPLFVAAALAGCGGETSENGSNTAATPNAPMHAEAEHDRSAASMGHDVNSPEHARMMEHQGTADHQGTMGHQGTAQPAPMNTGGNTAGSAPAAGTTAATATPAPVANRNDTAGAALANGTRNPGQGEGVTAQDQSNTEGDTRITQLVRQRVMANDGLSMGAKNCTIVTRAGVVTLRGEVDTARERTIIGGLARGVTGVRSVEDQLVVDAD